MFNVDEINWVEFYYCQLGLRYTGLGTDNLVNYTLFTIGIILMFVLLLIIALEILYKTSMEYRVHLGVFFIIGSLSSLLLLVQSDYGKYAIIHTIGSGILFFCLTMINIFICLEFKRNYLFGIFFITIYFINGAMYLITKYITNQYFGIFEIVAIILSGFLLFVSTFMGIWKGTNGIRPLNFTSIEKRLAGIDYGKSVEDRTSGIILSCNQQSQRSFEQTPTEGH